MVFNRYTFDSKLGKVFRLTPEDNSDSEVNTNLSFFSKFWLTVIFQWKKGNSGCISYQSPQGLVKVKFSIKIKRFGGTAKWTGVVWLCVINNWYAELMLLIPVWIKMEFAFMMRKFRWCEELCCIGFLRAWTINVITRWFKCTSNGNILDFTHTLLNYGTLIPVKSIWKELVVMSHHLCGIPRGSELGPHYEMGYCIGSWSKTGINAADLPSPWGWILLIAMGYSGL